MSETPIPADDFKLDGDRAWWIVDDCKKCGREGSQPVPHDEPCDCVWSLDRPCAEYGCDGGIIRQMGRRDGQACDCIAGRHTFDIEADCLNCQGRGWYTGADLSDPTGETPAQIRCDICEWSGTRTHRVSVVMVLPIVADADDLPDCPPLIEMDEGPALFFDEGVVVTEDAEPISLPSGARPGRFAAQLNVERITT